MAAPEPLAQLPGEHGELRYLPLGVGLVIDPFAPAGDAACGEARDALWSPASRQALAYQPTGLLIAGFDPCIWIFAGSKPLSHIRQLPKGRDFLSRISGNSINVGFKTENMKQTIFGLQPLNFMKTG